MGTLFFTSEMMPADDVAAERQVEILRPSGEHFLLLRLGLPGQEHTGLGSAVRLDESRAREVTRGLLAGMRYMGFDTSDLD